MIDEEAFVEFLTSSGFAYDKGAYMLTDDCYKYYVDVYPDGCDISVYYLGNPERMYTGMGFDAGRSIINKELEDDDEWGITQRKDYRYE